MKQIYTTIAASLLLCVGLVSCEMKKELFDNEEIPTETGLVELGVNVDDKTNVVITKTEATEGDEELGSSVDPSDFPVSFTLKTNENYQEEFVYSDIKGKTVELPIGTYTVISHTPGEMGKKMSEPYYKGNSELTVTKEVTQKAEVICTMQNSRIQVVYPDEFKEEFTEWTITIDDGTDNSLTFEYNSENQDLNPAAVYWAIAENCASLSISIKATTKSGASVSESRSVTKPSGAANNNWVGGDALTITMQPVEDNTGDVSGITINVSTFFETEKGDVIDVPLEDEDTETEPSEPTEPSEGLSLAMPNNGNISYSISEGNMPSKADVTIHASEGIQSLKVKITTTNEDFQLVLDELVGAGLDFKNEGVEVVNNATLGEILGAFAGGETIEFPVLTTEDKDYVFPIASFFTLLNNYGEGTHTFIIALTDNSKKTINDELVVTIKE